MLEVGAEIMRICVDAGGALSGEHGIGTAKRDAYLELSDPVRLELEAAIKMAFDPDGLLNPARSVIRRPTEGKSTT